MGVEIDGVNNTLKVGAQPFLKWQTSSIKTSTFTAVSGEGYLVNTTGGAVTVNLPAGVAGAVIGLQDYAGTWDTNNCTVAANGSEKIQGSTDNAIFSRDREALQILYVDSTQGWVITSVADQGGTQALYITASGGTETTSGDFKIHTFTSSGTFTVSSTGNTSGSNSVDYLVVAGGGAGPATGGGDGISGGGGGGGFRLYADPSDNPQSGNPASPLNGPAAIPVSATAYPITVGAGGSKGTAPSGWTNGSNSVFSTITSTGGGRGGRGDPSGTGQTGGSGGGANNNASGGAGNTPPVSPAQGTNGGDASLQTGGGGGGAIAAGADGTGSPGSGVSGNGGAGGGVTGFGTSGQSSGGKYYFSGGGGGGNGNGNFPSPGTVGTGGLGGGADGKNPSSPTPTASNGTVNTGGGGGGASDKTPVGGGGGAGGDGGSGIVVIRYKYQN